MRILGLDIGSTTVKAVEIESTFRRYDIHDYHERKVPENYNPLDVARELVSSLTRKPDRIVVALKTGQLTFRNLDLPTRDKKAIQASIGFELDDELPFALDQTLYDYAYLAQSSEGTQVHVVASLRKYMETALHDWLGIGVDPDVVTSEAWAYRAIFSRLQTEAEQEHPSLLLQLGHARSTLYVHWKGQPVLARDINWGGRDLTLAISQRYGVTLEQAENAKLDHGFILTEAQKSQATLEQVEFSDALNEALSELFQAIRQAELSCKQFTKLPLGAIYLSGGTSLLPGLNKVLQEQLQIPVKPLQALSAVATSGVTYSEAADASCGLASALALTVVGPARNTLINLRKGEYAKAGRSHDFSFVGSTRRIAMGTSIVVASILISTFVSKGFYQSEITEVDTRLERSMRLFFGQISSSAIRTYLASPKSLKNAVNKELTKQRESAKLLGPNPQSPLNFLKELSSTIPRDAIVDMIEFQAGAAPTENYSPTSSPGMKLTFIVANAETADRIAALLGGKVIDLSKTKLEEVTFDGAKKFRVTFTGKPTEDFYGR